MTSPYQTVYYISSGNTKKRNDDACRCSRRGGLYGNRWESSTYITHIITPTTRLTCFFQNHVSFDIIPLKEDQA